MRGKLERAFRAAAWDASADIALIDYEERCARRYSLAVFKAVALQAPVLDAATLPQLDLPMLSIQDLKEKFPSVYAKLEDGNFWTIEAEKELLELCL